MKQSFSLLHNDIIFRGLAQSLLAIYLDDILSIYLYMKYKQHGVNMNIRKTTECVALKLLK